MNRKPHISPTLNLKGRMAMDSNKKSFMGKALFIVAIAYLLYNIYQAIITTIFVSHFGQIVTQLPNFIQSSQPSLQIPLFLLQEISGSIGIYLRLAAGIFALYAAVLFIRKDQRYMDKFGRALLFESLYFALLIPVGINHVVGSTITSSEFLNIYTGASFLLQAVLIFPPLFMLSRKLKQPQNIPSILKWAGIAAPLYVYGLWVKHGLMWVYALSPLGTGQAGLVDAVGAADSGLTLLVAAIVATAAWLTFRQKKKLDTRIVGTALVLVGVYFVVYAVVSVWVPIYLAFLPLTEFWMITLPIIGITMLLNQSLVSSD
jgi:hypothetical protein